jgi:hypothetical protein
LADRLGRRSLQESPKRETSTRFSDCADVGRSSAAALRRAPRDGGKNPIAGRMPAPQRNGIAKERIVKEWICTGIELGERRKR